LWACRSHAEAKLLLEGEYKAKTQKSQDMASALNLREMSASACN
jgi:hypothetical protein